MKNFSAQTILEVTPKFEPENAHISIRSWISVSAMSMLAGRRQLENRQNAVNEAPSALEVYRLRRNEIFVLLEELSLIHNAKLQYMTVIDFIYNQLDIVEGICEQLPLARKAAMHLPCN